jgi:hypothetical protein
MIQVKQGGEYPIETQISNSKITNLSYFRVRLVQVKKGFGLEPVKTN